MADYLAAPQIQEPGEITLYGRRYRLAPETGPGGQEVGPGKVHVSLATSPLPKTVQGDYGKDDNPRISTYTVSDLSGGMGLWRYKTDNDLTPAEAGLQRTKFWTGQNCDGLWPGAMTLGPLPTTATNPGTAAFGGASVLADVVAVLWGTQIYTWSGSVFTSIDAIPGVAWGKIVRFNGRLFYPLGPNGYSYQTAAGSAATDVADPDAISFAVWDNKLYALDTAGTLWLSTTGDSGSWGSALATVPNIESQTSFVGSCLLVSSDLRGEPALYCVSAYGLFAYDPVNDKWFPSRFEYPFTRPYNVWKIMGGKFHDSLFLSPGLRTIFSLTPGGDALLVRDLSIDKHGLPAAFRLEVMDWAWDNRLLFVLLTSDVFDITESGTEGELLLAWNGLGFHPLRFRSETGGAVPRRIEIVSPSALRRLLYGIRTTLSAQSAEWIDLNLLYQHPLFSTQKTYAASGEFELPVFDGAYEAQQKVALQVRVKLNGASATETLQLAARLDGAAGAYTNYGTATTSDTERTIELGTNELGVAFKAWQWRWTLARGGTTTNAPKIQYVALDYLRVPDNWRGFVVRVDCRRPSPDGRTPRQQVDNIWSAIETATLGSFGFRDDSGNTRSYKVKIERPEGIEETGLDESGIYTLALPSFGSNTV